MMYTKYLLLAICSVLMTIVAVLLSPILPLFVDPYGNLPAWLRWLQTPDNPCYGAPFWAQKNPTYGVYSLCLTWFIRNPAQGFDQYLKANVDYDTPVAVSGDLTISDQIPVRAGYFFITGGGVFQYRRIITGSPGHTWNIDLGWRLDPIAKGYKTPTLGAIIVTPVRRHANPEAPL